MSEKAQKELDEDLKSVVLHGRDYPERTQLEKDIRDLVAQGANLRQSVWGASLMELAAGSGRLESIKVLSENFGMPLSGYKEDLMYDALSGGNIGLVKYLDSKGAVNPGYAREETGQTYAHAAARGGNRDSLEYVDKTLHVDMFSANSSGDFVQHEVVRRLLIPGSVSNVDNALGALSYLQETGHDLNQPNAKGERIYDMIAKSQSIPAGMKDTIMTYLENHEAGRNAGARMATSPKPEGGNPDEGQVTKAGLADRLEELRQQTGQDWKYLARGDMVYLQFSPDLSDAQKAKNNDVSDRACTNIEMCVLATGGEESYGNAGKGHALSIDADGLMALDDTQFANFVQNVKNLQTAPVELSANQAMFQKAAEGVNVNTLAAAMDWTASAQTQAYKY